MLPQNFGWIRTKREHIGKKNDDDKYDQLEVLFRFLSFSFFILLMAAKIHSS